jgi:hypothetical protein
MINQNLIDVVLPFDTGYPEELAATDTSEAVVRSFGETSREFPDSLWVEPSEVRARAEQNDELGLWAENYWDRFTNQNPTHECTCHALVAVFEAAWNRQRRISLKGPVAGERLKISAESASVWMAVNSVYPEANPRQWGGASCQQVIGIACRRGFVPDKIQPKNYNFKCSMPGTCGKGGINQSKGAWPGWRNGDFIVDIGDWREVAKHFMPQECVNPKNTAEYDSLLINGCAIGIGRSGHSVPVGRIVYDNGRKLYRYKDSYDVFRYDSRAYTSGAYSIITVKQPDSWDKPAG